MDWLERWLGMSREGWLGRSLDNGDGTLELLLVLLAVAALGAFLVGRNERGRAALLRIAARCLPGRVAPPR